MKQANARYSTDERIERYDVPEPQQIAGEETYFTPKEAELVRLLASGLSGVEIAHLIGRSRHTVKNTLNTMYVKFGVTGATHMVALALSIGEITPEELHLLVRAQYERCPDGGYQKVAEGRRRYRGVCASQWQVIIARPPDGFRRNRRYKRAGA